MRYSATACPCAAMSRQPTGSWTVQAAWRSMKRRTGFMYRRPSCWSCCALQDADEVDESLLRLLLDLRREQHLAAAEYQPVPGRRDDDLVYAHVRGGFCDEAYHATHVFHLQHARLILGRRRLGPRLLQRRDRLAGVDGATADPVHAFLDVDLVDQRAQRLLARVVGGAADIALVAGEIGRDVDHQAVAPRAHRRQHRERAVERPVQVDADHAVPLPRVEILEETLRDVGAGAIDEDIDAAMPREDRGRGAFDRLLVGGIDRLGFAFAAGFLDQRRGLGERIGPPPGQDHRRAGSRELDRGRLPDAAAAPGNPRDLVAQCRHGPDSVVFVLDHHGSGELVVPALLALVEGDPDESEHEDAG